MSLKPILFSTEMVRALLEGRKTVTRRVVKPQPEGRPVPVAKDSCWPGYFAIQGTERVVRPPYQPGDVLYVRETWCEKMGRRGEYLYRAYAGERDDTRDYVIAHNTWRSSIHMPREAARIFLRVTKVSVERLQDITPIQAKQEGIPDSISWHVTRNGSVKLETARFGIDDAIGCFRSLWYQAVKDADRHAYGWEANPWVWVIEFERISKEESKHAKPE